MSGAFALQYKVRHTYYTCCSGAELAFISLGQKRRGEVIKLGHSKLHNRGTITL